MDALYAYLAGIIDGEGTVTIQKQGNARMPAVSIANSCLPLLEKCAAIPASPHVLYRKKKYQSHHSDPWTLIWRYDAAVTVAALVLPWLTAKRRHAEILQQWKTVVKRNGMYTPAELALRDGLVDRIRALTARPTRNAAETAACRDS
jgi:hypothetical protein